VDIYFTRDNIYLRLMENQKVKDVKSLYSILTSTAEAYSPVQNMKAVSMFPGCSGEPVSIAAVYNDIIKEKKSMFQKTEKKRQGILQFFHF
jgi:hypothetical protein